MPETILAPTEGNIDKDPVASIAGQIAHLSTGDHAALRRLRLTQSTAADGVVVKLLVQAGVPEHSWQHPAAFAQWRLLAHIAALLSGTAAQNPHHPKISLGQALQAANYSENRLLRLLAARDEGLTDQVVYAARYLAKAGQIQVNLKTFYKLLKDDEQTRETIARDYYKAEYYADKPKGANS